MPREIVTIQVGQCGNQIGRCFWDLLLKEHASINKDGVFDDVMSSYFRNVDACTGKDLYNGNGESRTLISSLRARAILVDTEEGVLKQTLASPLGELFDETKIIRSGVSGAGNNFCHGFYGYGEEYGLKIIEGVRHEVEHCDSLQAFFLIHSIGGGTGSGLGCNVLERLSDAFPRKLRFTASVFPTKDDDVITSPYNSTFALHHLREHADAIFPMDNQALMDICANIKAHHIVKPTVATLAERLQRRDITHAASNLKSNVGNRRFSTPLKKQDSDFIVSTKQSTNQREEPFDDMNSLAGHMLSNLTSCARFHGKMNVDISELTTNLVPFPRLQFLLASLSPLFTLQGDYNLATGGGSKFASPNQVDHAFSDTLSRSNQLLKCDPANGRFLACALLTRGNINLSDINRNVARITRTLDFPYWNSETAFKVGHCAVSPPGHPHSILLLSNNSCAADIFADMEKRFRALYGVRRKAYLHHYTQYTSEDEFENALDSLQSLQYDYKDVQKPLPEIRRINVL